MKKYEAVYNQHLTPNSCVLVRVDGRCFHQYTKNCRKPFDDDLIKSMVDAAVATSKEMTGFKLGYAQSDEVTFLLTDYESHQSEPWFANKLNKIVSITASTMTAYFNDLHSRSKLATFDARAFVVPRQDVPNAFIWRQKDWERNSLLMLAQANFSHRELQGKKTPDLHDMLRSADINWAKLDPQKKNGTWFSKSGISYEHADYYQVDRFLTKLGV